jgi:hypothetical protein
MTRAMDIRKRKIVIFIGANLINTPLQRGERGARTGSQPLQRFLLAARGLAACPETAQAVQGVHRLTFTPLKRGVNEILTTRFLLSMPSPALL